MNKHIFHSVTNIFLLRLTLINIFFLIFIVSCITYKEKGDLNKIDPVTMKSDANEISKGLQNYLLVGAKGRYGKGSVFKCNLDGSECSEFLGGGIKFQAPTNQKLRTTLLFNRDEFGSSIFVTKDKILIGSMGRNNKKATDAASMSSANFKEDIGGLFQCNIEGTECVEFLGGHLGFPTPSGADRRAINLLPGDNFGSSIFVTKDKILIGAMGRDSNSKDDAGSVFQCNLDGKSCIEFIGGKNKTSNIEKFIQEFDALGSGIFSTNSELFIGVKNKNGGNGGVFKCSLDGKKCDLLNVSNLHLTLNDNFGSSIAGNSSNIFIGAIGRNGIPVNDSSLYDIGSVFKCKIDGSSCVEFIGGENKASAKSLSLSANDYLGSSIVVSGNFLYIGAMGRKNNSDMRTGAVFRCNLDGKNCLEFIAGKNTENTTAESIDLLDGDLFGSSLAILSLSN